VLLPFTNVSGQQTSGSKLTPPSPIVAPRDTFTKIDDAYQMGEISYDEKGRLFASALFQRDEMPSKYAPEIVAEDITTHILDLSHNWDRLSPETQSLLRGHAGFPGAPDWGASIADCATGAGVISFNAYVDTLHFRIHYHTSTTTASYANTIGSSAEVGFTVRKSMVFNDARRDGLVGGGINLFDIYLEDLQAYGFYGVAFADATDDSSSNPNDYIGYVCVDRNLPADRLQSTPVHEYHHLVQFAYNGWQSGWLMEATSTWFQEKAFPSNTQYYSRIATFMQYADYELTSTISDREYGAAAFLLYCDTQMGNDVVRLMWDKSVRNTFSESPGFQAVKDALKLSTYGYDWITFIFDFWAAMQLNYAYASRYSRGYHLYVVDQASWSWPQYYGIGAYGGTTISQSDTNFVLRWGGCDTVAFSSSLSTFKITFDGDDAGNFMVAAILLPKEGLGIQASVVRLGPGGPGTSNVATLKIINGLNYNEIDFFIVNRFYDTGTTSYGWTVSVGPP